MHLIDILIACTSFLVGFLGAALLASAGCSDRKIDEYIKRKNK